MAAYLVQNVEDTTADLRHVHAFSSDHAQACCSLPFKTSVCRYERTQNLILWGIVADLWRDMPKAAQRPRPTTAPKPHPGSTAVTPLPPLTSSAPVRPSGCCTHYRVSTPYQPYTPGYELCAVYRQRKAVPLTPCESSYCAQASTA